MSDKPPHDPTPIVVAYQWAARIISLSITMVVPGLLGVWVDGRLGTKVVFTLVGFAAGMAYAGWQLIRMTARPKQNQDAQGPDKRGRGGP